MVGLRNTPILRSAPKERRPDISLPRHFFHVEVDEGVIRRKILRVLFFGWDPEIDFHPGWIGLYAREGACDRIADFMGVGIAGPFSEALGSDPCALTGARIHLLK
jgi:hypothetical protein